MTPIKDLNYCMFCFVLLFFLFNRWKGQHLQFSYVHHKTKRLCRMTWCSVSYLVGKKTELYTVACGNGKNPILISRWHVHHVLTKIHYLFGEIESTVIILCIWSLTTYLKVLLENFVGSLRWVMIILVHVKLPYS